MSTTQFASLTGFCPPQEELASFRLGSIVEYLKEVPSSFDLDQDNGICCDPSYGKWPLVEFALRCLFDDRADIVQYPNTFIRTLYQWLQVNLIQQRMDSTPHKN